MSNEEIKIRAECSFLLKDIEDIYVGKSVLTNVLYTSIKKRLKSIVEMSEEFSNKITQLEKRVETLERKVS